jgi:hypothetical protein
MVKNATYVLQLEVQFIWLVVEALPYHLKDYNIIYCTQPGHKTNDCRCQ